jgi:hypothetical protein
MLHAIILFIWSIQVSRPLAPLISRLVSDIPISQSLRLVLRLHSRRLSKKLGVLNENVVYSDNKGIEIPETCRIPR